MIYKYSPNNPARFATNLRLDKTTKNLMWDNANGQDVLIVQTPFGSSAIDYIEEICHLLPNATLLQIKLATEGAALMEKPVHTLYSVALQTKTCVKSISPKIRQ